MAKPRAANAWATALPTRRFPLPVISATLVLDATLLSDLFQFRKILDERCLPVRHGGSAEAMINGRVEDAIRRSRGGGAEVGCGDRFNRNREPGLPNDLPREAAPGCLAAVGHIVNAPRRWAALSPCPSPILPGT